MMGTGAVCVVVIMMSCLLQLSVDNLDMLQEVSTHILHFSSYYHLISYVSPGQVFPLYWFEELDVKFSDNIPILLENVKCHTGYEGFMLECSYPECNTHSCIHAYDVVVECTGISVKTKLKDIGMEVPKSVIKEASMQQDGRKHV